MHPLASRSLEDSVLFLSVKVRHLFLSLPAIFSNPSASLVTRRKRSYVMNPEDVKGYTILILAWLLSFILVKPVLSRAVPPRTRLPPSPFALPIIGHLHLLRPIPHRALERLVRGHGPLIRLSFGSVPFVVASPPEMERESLRVHEGSFSNRPSTVAIWCLTYGVEDFSFAPYGPFWKFMKKLCMIELLGGRTIEQFLPVRHEEVETLIKKMRLGPTYSSLAQSQVRVWSAVLHRLQIGRRSEGWDGELQQGITRGKGRKLDSIIYRLFWTLYIYYIWQARNRLLFQGEPFVEQ